MESEDTRRTINPGYFYSIQQLEEMNCVADSAANKSTNGLFTDQRSAFFSEVTFRAKNS